MTDDPVADVPLEGDFLDKWVLPYLKEPALWPVAFAIVGHIDTVLVLIILETVRNLHPVTTAALLILIGLSVQAGFSERRSKGKFGALSVLLGVVWGSSGLIAALLYPTDIL